MAKAKTVLIVIGTGGLVVLGVWAGRKIKNWANKVFHPIAESNRIQDERATANISKSDINPETKAALMDVYKNDPSAMQMALVKTGLMQSILSKDPNETAKLMDMMKAGKNADVNMILNQRNAQTLLGMKLKGGTKKK